MCGRCEEGIGGSIFGPWSSNTVHSFDLFILIKYTHVVFNIIHEFECICVYRKFLGITLVITLECMMG